MITNGVGGFNGSGMVAIFPESSFATLALIICLAGATSYLLDGRWNGFGPINCLSPADEMIRSDRIFQNLQGEPFAGFEQPRPQNGSGHDRISTKTPSCDSGGQCAEGAGGTH
jgi:hypothetical protein